MIFFKAEIQDNPVIFLIVHRHKLIHVKRSETWQLTAWSFWVNKICGRHLNHRQELVYSCRWSTTRAYQQSLGHRLLFRKGCWSAKAVDLPRLLISQGCWRPRRVIEQGDPEETVDKLRRLISRGWSDECVDTKAVDHPSMIRWSVDTKAVDHPRMIRRTVDQPRLL
jgi:hypothetical protein